MIKLGMSTVCPHVDSLFACRQFVRMSSVCPLELFVCKFEKKYVFIFKNDYEI